LTAWNIKRAKNRGPAAWKGNQTAPLRGKGKTVINQRSRGGVGLNKKKKRFNWGTTDKKGKETGRTKRK